MVYVFDIDDTICIRDDKNDLTYLSAYPIPDRIEKINQLYDEGHTIYFLTARGMGRSNNKNPENLRGTTEQQLFEWGVKYHELFMGKPAADYYIDDKGISDKDFFN